MSFSYGFYNYSDGDQVDDKKIYDAVDMSMIFDGIIMDGVYAHVGSKFMALGVANGAENTVIIGSGRAWLNGTWNYNDDALYFELTPPPLSNSRIDAIVIDVNTNDRHNQISLVEGTASESPTKPTLASSDGHYQYPICYVTRRSNTPVIPDVDIENAVGSGLLPYVTGVLETIDATEILVNFHRSFDYLFQYIEDEYFTWFSKAKRDYDTFMSDSETSFNFFLRDEGNQFNSWLDGLRNDYDQVLADQTALITSWFTTTEAQYDAWFENLTTDIADTPISDTQWSSLQALWAIS